MKKLVLLSMTVAVACAALLALDADTASAFPAFKTAFDKKYMVEGSALHTALEGRSNCNVCHLGPKDRKKRNDYGVALDKLLSKEDMKNPEKISEAFAKVEAEKAGATTFGELIKQGKLPITKEE